MTLPRAPVVLMVLALLAACRSASAPVAPTPPTKAAVTTAAPAQPVPKAQLVAIDIFGTKQVTLEQVLAKSGPELRRRCEDAIASDSFPDLRPVVKEIETLGDFAQIEPALIGYYEPDGMKYYLTLDFVDRADAARRRPFFAAPTGTHEDPEALLADWHEYEKRVFALMGAQKMSPDRVACPAFHCLGDSTNPEVKPLFDGIVTRAPRHVAELAAILHDDKSPGKRGTAAYVLAFSSDGVALVKLLLPSINDPDSLVRNNVMRVLYDIAAYHPEVDVPLDPVLAALDFPETTDRNKASAVVSALLKRPGAESLRCPIAQRAGTTLLAMLRLEQPNNHGFAYIILKALSGKDLGERNYDAWQAWLDAAPSRCH